MIQSITDIDLCLRIYLSHSFGVCYSGSNSKSITFVNTWFHGVLYLVPILDPKFKEMRFPKSQPLLHLAISRPSWPLPPPPGLSLYRPVDATTSAPLCANGHVACKLWRVHVEPCAGPWACILHVHLLCVPVMRVGVPPTVLQLLPALFTRATSHRPFFFSSYFGLFPWCLHQLSLSTRH